MTVKPIGPHEVGTRKQASIPPVVIEAFNALVNRWDGKSATVKVKDIVAELEGKIERDLIFRHRYLDVEEMFRAAGWTVIFDQPGFNETYDAYFIFRA